MEIRFNCPHCGTTIRASANHVGRSSACPKCRGKLTVPSPPASPELTVPGATVAGGPATRPSSGGVLPVAPVAKSSDQPPGKSSSVGPTPKAPASGNRTPLPARPTVPVLGEHPHGDFPHGELPTLNSVPRRPNVVATNPKNISRETPNAVPVLMGSGTGESDDAIEVAPIDKLLAARPAPKPPPPPTPPPPTDTYTLPGGVIVSPQHIRFPCPHCQVGIKAPRSVAGRKSRCPECAQRVRVPDPSGLAPAVSDPDTIQIGTASVRAAIKSAPVEDGLHRVLPVDATPTNHIRVECEACGSVIKAPRTLAGRKSHCPNCKASIRIPAERKLATEELDGFELEKPLSTRQDKLAFNVAAATNDTLSRKPAANFTDNIEVANPAVKPSPVELRFNCGSCWELLRANYSEGGKRGYCPQCGQSVQVPDAPPIADADGNASVEIQMLEQPTVRKRDVSGTSTGWDEVELTTSMVGAKSGGPSGNFRGGALGTSGSVGAQGPAGSGQTGGIRFDCPNCKATIKSPPMYAGKRSRCPKCKARVTIPAKPPDPRPQEPTSGIDMLSMSSSEEMQTLASLAKQTRRSVEIDASGMASQQVPELSGEMPQLDPLTSNEDGLLATQPASTAVPPKSTVSSPGVAKPTGAVPAVNKPTAIPRAPSHPPSVPTNSSRSLPRSSGPASPSPIRSVPHPSAPPATNSTSSVPRPAPPKKPPL